MKLKMSKKYIVFVVIVLIVLGVFLFLQNRNLTPRETIELYFSYFSSKDTAGMQSLVSDRLKSQNGETEYYESVQFLSCYEEMREERISYTNLRNIWYPEAEHVVKYFVTFRVKYADGRELDDVIYRYDYYLAKKAEKDPWIIVAYGH